MLALFGGFAARGLVDVDALQVRYSRPRQLELAAGRTVVLTGRSSPKRWPPPPGRPDGAFERLGLNAQALAGPPHPPPTARPPAGRRHHPAAPSRSPCCS